jgi:hypothetical protein
MTLASTNLVPELQSWFYRFVMTSYLNKSETPVPTTIDAVYLPQKSFIELLFNKNYQHHEYKYLYASDTNKYGWPYVVRNRLMVYPASARYYTLNDHGTNFFNLQHDDFVLLDSLLVYRTDTTSTIHLTIHDLTILHPLAYFDSTSNILYANFNDLNTNLSKLIFLYLDLKLYNHYLNYDTTTLISETLLESLFEAYVIEEMYDYMTNTELYS